MTTDHREAVSSLDPLTRLAIRHGSDKFGAHLYTPSYHEVLYRLRDRPIRLLEIGVGGYDARQAGGSSLRMWADYFSHGLIVGLDYAEKSLDISPRVTIECGSQADAAVLDRLVERHGPFDVIIDDGSHQPAHIVFSFRSLYPRMSEDGIYVVEDTQLAFRPEGDGHSAGRGSIFELGHQIALAMHAAEGHQPASEEIAGFGRTTRSITTIRNAMIFVRGTNTYPSNLAFDIDRPEVADIYDLIAHEADAHPAPRSALSRIDMNIWGGRADRAEALALQAAHAHPRDLELLAELERMMIWAGRHDAAGSIRALREAQAAV